MRAYYLKKANYDQQGCRGGVGDPYPDSNDYELEIGQGCNASSEMIALCVLHDEIIEHLEDQKSLMGKLLLEKYKNIVKDINKNYDSEKNS